MNDSGVKTHHTSARGNAAGTAGTAVAAVAAGESY
jgi:hypothetical protein